MDGFDISEAGNKFRILRSSYWNERSKTMKSGAGADSVYKLKVPWFPTANHFLVKIYNWGQSHSNLVSAYIFLI
jgi:hypothetical protein